MGVVSFDVERKVARAYAWTGRIERVIGGGVVKLRRGRSIAVPVRLVGLSKLEVETRLRRARVNLFQRESDDNEIID